MFFHVLSFSFIFSHFLSFIFFHSFSFIFLHFLSFFLFFFFFLLGAQNFFLGLSFVTISLECSYVKNQFWALWALFAFFSSFFSPVFFLALPVVYQLVTIWLSVKIRLRVVYGGRRVIEGLPSYQNRQSSALDETAYAPQSSLFSLLHSLFSFLFVLCSCSSLSFVFLSFFTSFLPSFFLFFSCFLVFLFSFFLSFFSFFLSFLFSCFFFFFFFLAIETPSIHLSHTPKPHWFSRFLESESVCGSTLSHSDSAKQPRNSQLHLRKEQSSQAQQDAKQAQRKMSGIPNNPPQNGTNGFENFTTHIRTGQTIHADSFTVHLNPFPFSINHSLPTLTFLFFGFLVQLLPFFFFTFHILPQPPAEKVVLVHGLVLTEQVSVFCGQGSSVFQRSLSGDVPQPFLRHETSHLKLFPRPFAPLPGDPSSVALQLSIFSRSWQGPTPPREFRFVKASVHILSCPTSLACIDSAILVPVWAVHKQNTFCTELRPLHFGRRFSPYRVLPSVFPHVSACVWSPLAATLVLHIVLACSCVRCFFRISYTDMCLLPHTTPCDASLLPFLLTAVHFSFGCINSLSC